LLTVNKKLVNAKPSPDGSPEHCTVMSEGKIESLQAVSKPIKQ
jgi:hypothetical protein